MKSLLLVGHGYLGREVASRFRTVGWRVLATSLHGGDDSVVCDICDPSALATLGFEPDWIIHCASTGRGGPDAYRRVFKDGCGHLQAAFPAARLVFVSSTSVYAQTDGSWVDESSPAEPSRETSAVLLETERLVLAAGGLVARLAGIYGPGRSVILSRFLSGQAVIEGDGGRYLNQIHRDDAAAALFHLVTRGLAGRVFNVADGAPLAQAACYGELSTLFGLPLPPCAPPDLDRKRGWTHKRVSNAALRATGWEPAFPWFPAAARGIAATLHRAE